MFIKKNAYALFFFLALCVSKEILAQTKAIKSDDFVERIGFGAHFNMVGTPYVKNFDSVAFKINELGIRYIRSGADEHSKILHERYGIKILAGIIDVSEFDSSLVAPVLDEIKQDMGTEMFYGFEGVNEPDQFAAAGWPEKTRQTQEALYRKIKSDPDWNHVKVLGPSNGGSGYEQTGNMEALSDEGNIHYYHEYPGNEVFFTKIYGYVSENNYPSGGPIVMTETGFSQDEHSEAEVAKYEPRMFMYYLYKKNISRVFQYEFIDEWDNALHESNFGILRNDCSEKPAYNALQNTIKLLTEKGASFNPDTLRYSITGDMTNIHHVLFQKSNGIFYLAVWQEITGKNGIVNPGRNLTLSIPSYIKSAKVYLPAPWPIGNGLTPNMTFNDQYSLALSVPDQLMLVELTPESVIPVNASGITTMPFLTLVKGKNKQLNYEIQPVGATNKSVTWVSADNTIATVNNGVITALKAGKVIISAITVDGSLSANTLLTVIEIPVSAVRLNPSSLIMDTSGHKTAQLTYSTEPIDAFNKAVSWSSGNPNIAKVDPDGLVTAVSLGSTFITVKTADGNKTAICPVKVFEDISGVHTIKLEVAAEWNFVGTFVVSNGTSWDTIKYDNPEITLSGFTRHGGGWYESYNPGSYAQYTFTGSVIKFFAIKRGWGGTGKIYFDNEFFKEVSFEGEGDTNLIFKRDFNITALEKMKVDSVVSLNVNDSLQLKLELFPLNATVLSTTWKVISPTIATVSPSGMLKGVKAGGTRIVVSVTTPDETRKAYCTVKVLPVTNSFSPASESNDFKVYPDPVQKNGKLNIKLKKKDFDRKLTINLLDMQGNLVLSKTFEHTNNPLELSLPTNINAGMYVIYVIGDKTVLTSKLVVQ